MNISAGDWIQAGTSQFRVVRVVYHRDTRHCEPGTAQHVHYAQVRAVPQFKSLPVKYSRYFIPVERCKVIRKARRAGRA